MFKCTWYKGLFSKASNNEHTFIYAMSRKLTWWTWNLFIYNILFLILQSVAWFVKSSMSIHLMKSTKCWWRFEFFLKIDWFWSNSNTWKVKKFLKTALAIYTHLLIALTISNLFLQHLLPNFLVNIWLSF